MDRDATHVSHTGGTITHLNIVAPERFDLLATCASHGWIVLPPCRFDMGRGVFHRTERLAGGQVVDLTVLQSGATELAVTIWAVFAPGIPDLQNIADRIRTMLRLDEDLSEFETLCEKDPRWRARVRPGGGRLLRSPTVFEDVVKTICTTNTTWAQTEQMTRRLVTQLGAPHPLGPERRAFPTPEAIAKFGEDRLRKEIRMGYRARYLAEIAVRLASGHLDLEALRSPTLTGDNVRQQLRELPGIGPYGAATVSMLLGHYDELAIDSELRSFVATHYYGDRPVTESEIHAVYAPWGKWQYLAYWFDSGSTET